MKEEFPIETIRLLDELVASDKGRVLIQERWQHAIETAKAKAGADRKAAEEARRDAPGPLTGWDCWVCDWKGERPDSMIGGARCPSCHCLHGLRSAPGSWRPHRR